MHLPALLQFLAELHANNTKSWFLHNKPHYDILREEFVELVADIGYRIQQFDDDLPPFTPKKALLRIYRDIRFYKDKSPLKTHFGAMIGARTTDKTRPMYYLQIDHNGRLMVACGLYMPDKIIHQKLRNALASDPKKFTAVLTNTRLLQIYGGVSEEDRMVRPPKGYSADLPMIEHIKNRHFICVTETNLLSQPPKQLAAWIAERCEAAYPLVKWIRQASR